MAWDISNLLVEKFISSFNLDSAVDVNGGEGGIDSPTPVGSVLRTLPFRQFLLGLPKPS